MALKELTSYGNYSTDKTKRKSLPRISPEELAAAMSAVKVGEAPNFTAQLLRGDVIVPSTQQKNENLLNPE
jgi:hypothetical protein